MGRSNGVSLLLMKVLLAGTHFTPAVAVINELKKRGDIQIIYVGRKTTREGDSSPSAESAEIPKLGVKFIPLIAGRLQRTFTPYTIPSLLKIPVGFTQSLWIILSQNPDVVLSFGGYVGLPLVIAGWLFSKPVIIHQQTLVSGLANKISSLFADIIAVSFENQANSSSKVILTGNPLRDGILNPVKKIPPDFIQLLKYSKRNRLPLMLIMGGNQGSHIINTTVEKILPQLIKSACVIHLTGDNKFADYERLKKFQSERYIVKKWIGEELGKILSEVDLAVCRSGINSLVELAFFNVAALVIPIPYLYQDEQNKNAKYFEHLGMVRILPQSKLTGKSLLKTVKAFFRNLATFKKQTNNARKIIVPDAAKRLALETILLAERDRL